MNLAVTAAPTLAPDRALLPDAPQDTTHLEDAAQNPARAHLPHATVTAVATQTGLASERDRAARDLAK